MSADSPSTLQDEVASLRETNKPSSSYFVWLGCVIFLVVVKIVLDTYLPNAFADPAQASFFTWPVLGVFSAVGLVGVWLSTKTGFPDAWDPWISNRQRLLNPILVGMALGVVLVVVDLPTGYTRLIAAAHGVGQQYTNFLSMLLVFSAAAILLEVIYRLLPLPLLLWLISNLILRKRVQAAVFWVLALLSSVQEIISQITDFQVLPVPLAVVIGVFFFVLNLVQVTFFRRYGFLAAILVRVGFYFVWHALYVH
jgi:hypothetical protein